MTIRSTIRILIVFGLAQFGANIKADDSKHHELKQAEKLIDAFYSFDTKILNKALETAPSSKPLIIFYQGWAKGGNYEIVKRMTCTETAIDNKNITIDCSITVRDDLMKALNIPFDVTDTFHLTFQKQLLIKVTTSSNDLQVYRDAESWVFSQRNAWVKEVCKGYFKGGSTPGKCVNAMVRGYAEFAKSEDFPAEVIFE